MKQKYKCDLFGNMPVWVLSTHYTISLNSFDTFCILFFRWDKTKLVYRERSNKENKTEKL